MDEAFLQLLQCPITKEPLRVASAELVELLNQRISSGELENTSGDRVERAIDGALVNESEKWAFPIRGGIPTLLETDSILLEKVNQTRDQ